MYTETLACSKNLEDRGNLQGCVPIRRPKSSVVEIAMHTCPCSVIRENDFSFSGRESGLALVACRELVDTGLLWALGISEY